MGFMKTQYKQDNVHHSDINNDENEFCTENGYDDLKFRGS